MPIFARRAASITTLLLIATLSPIASSGIADAATTAQQSLPALSATQPTQLRPDIDTVRRLLDSATAHRYTSPQWLNLGSGDGRESCTIVGTVGPDVIHGTPGPDRICALGGDDIVYGEGGDDLILGGSGSDELHGDAGKDEIRGGADNDIIFGDDGDDRLLGDEYSFDKTVTGNDLIYAGAGSDYVAGGPGNDLINTGSNDITHLGQDIAEGNDGNDVIVGGLVAWTNDYFGGNGNDLLYPSPLRLSPLGNAVMGGKGDDIAILVNGQYDGFTADEGLAIKVPIAAGCTVTVVAPGQGKAHSLSCALGNSVGKVSVGVNTDGKTTVGGSFFNGMAGSKLSDLAGHPTVGGDVCICDPKTIPELPYDFQS